MATATTSISLSPQDFLSILKKSSLRPTKSSLSFASATSTKIISPFEQRTIFLRNPLRKKATPIWWRIHATATATPTEAPPLEATAVETAQQIVSGGAGGDDGVSTIISALLFAAFIGLSILTIGVIYIGVSDFLQKREREKFDKEEEAARKKNSGKKKNKARTRAGPRGFGQRVDEENGDDD